MKTILIVDANEHDRNAAMALLNGSYNVMACSTITQATDIVRRRKPNAIMLDMASGCIDGKYTPREVATKLAPQAGIVCSATIDTANILARSLGASGFVQKPYRADDLFSAIRLASVWAETQPSSNGMLHIESTPPAPGNDEKLLLGGCDALQKVIKRIALYAAYDSPVLIVGESGTGKELAAAAIHRASRRSGNRFLPVDCASIPETLADSRLFGTEKGAFTDAVESKGVFESAVGGTVFLDEIGELSLTVQAKFLRTLETGTGCRVGSVDQAEYNVRILSATNADLFDDRKRFRPELIYRLDTLILEMPALREHKEDIPLLADSFMAEFAPGKRLSREALSKLMKWDWPGNVRELKNAVRRAAVLSGSSDEIQVSEIELDGTKKAWQASLL